MSDKSKAMGPSTGTFQAPFISIDESKDRYINQLEKYMDDLYDRQEKNRRKFFIPTIGTEVRLSEDITIKLSMDIINVKFLAKYFDDIKISYIGDKYPSYVTKETVSKKYQSKIFTQTVFFCKLDLPKGLSLIIDKMYIKKNMSSYDSITFRLGKKQVINNVAWSGRFWLPLKDVNNLTVDVKES